MAGSSGSVRVRWSGLARSAVAADVLAEAVGVPAENTTKWVTEAARQPARMEELEQLSARLNRASPSVRTRALAGRARAVAAETDGWRLRPPHFSHVSSTPRASAWAARGAIAQAGEAPRVLVDDGPVEADPVLLATGRTGSAESMCPYPRQGQQRC
jgi:hypothetical protein